MVYRAEGAANTGKGVELNEATAEDWQVREEVQVGLLGGGQVGTLTQAGAGQQSGSDRCRKEGISEYDASGSAQGAVGVCTAAQPTPKRGLRWSNSKARPRILKFSSQIDVFC